MRTLPAALDPVLGFVAVVGSYQVSSQTSSAPSGQKLTPAPTPAPATPAAAAPG